MGSYATGGSRDIGGDNPANDVLPAEMWSPATGNWTTLASMATPRGYHSTAILLPDGRVLVAGGGHNYVNNNDFYRFRNLFAGLPVQRPASDRHVGPSQIQCGSTFTVSTPDAASIASVSLIRNGADTHGFNEDQRFLPLNFTQVAGGLSIQAPANTNYALPAITCCTL